MEQLLASVKQVATTHPLALVASLACLVLIVLVLMWKVHSCSVKLEDASKSCKSSLVGGRDSKGRYHQGAGGASGALGGDSDQPYFQGGGVMNQYASGVSQYINTGDDSAIHHAHAREGGYAEVGDCPEWDGSAAAEVQALVAASGYLPEHGSYLDRTDHYAYNDHDASMTMSSLTSNDSYGADGTDAISAAMAAANSTDPERGEWALTHDTATGRQFTAEELAAAAKAHSAAAAAAPTADLAAQHAAASNLAANAAQTAPVAGTSTFKPNHKHRQIAKAALAHAQHATRAVQGRMRRH